MMKLIILSIFSLISKQDLPVHCLAKDIAGTWTLYIQSEIFNNQPSCGHQKPDKNTGISFIRSYVQ